MAPISRDVGKRRRSLAFEINRIRTEGTELDFEFMQQIRELEVAAAGFRHHAQRTQADQNRILQLYREICQAQDLKPGDEELDSMTERQRDLTLFPQDEPTLYHQLRIFLMMVAAIAPGVSAKHLTYIRLTKYRLAMIFWTSYIFDKYDIPRLPKNTLHNKMTEVMRAAAANFGLRQGSLNPNRSEVGLPELRQLIDHDMLTTPNIAVSEGHQLAWCLMRVCNVRPGGIGWSDRQKEQTKMYLTWRDVEITRGERRADFVATITFRSLKTNIIDPDRGANKALPFQQLKAKVLSPRSNDGLIFSIVHRILAIAIRRKILVNISWPSVSCESAISPQGASDGPIERRRESRCT